MIAPGRAAAAGAYRRVVLAMSSQSGKSDMLLDIIGQKLDQAPTPILYVGPNRQFLLEQWEPRVMDLLDQAPALASKVARGQANKKTRKLIAGVPLRLAHGGSSTALKSDPAGLALTDEADELERTVRGQGDPISLIDERGKTYDDFTHVIVSTPSKGPKDVETDAASGLEFWAEQVPEEIDSKIWKLWQEGTRYHWAWRCAHCSEWFIPRFSCVEIPDIRKTSPSRARAEAHIVCPRNGCIITDEHRASMILTGAYVAPGQTIDEDGNVVGDPPESETVSFWVSGLCSPFHTIGGMAAKYVTALRSGDNAEVQTVLNGQFGELWAPMGGDVPEWEHVRGLALPYREGEVPAGVVFLTAGVDVQKNRLVYVIRGWGSRQESWLITRGEIWGETALEDVWTDLADILGSTFDGLHIARMFVDAGFRPGKKDIVPEHRVYEFARRFNRQVYATKGYDTRPTPVSVNRLDVAPAGGRSKYGIDLVRISTDFVKSWVHERLRWPVDQPGGWHVFEGIDEDYCAQIVSEARVKKPKGGFQWIAKHKNNHMLDCFDEETELLTEDGWMRVADAVRYAGNFATVNLVTDAIEYQQATASVEREHDGEMVEIKGRTVDVLVTPNHRMVTTRRNPVDLAPQITLAGDLTIWHALKKTGTWAGVDPGRIEFAAIHVPVDKRKPMVQPALSFDPGDWFEFLGWFVSEGHTQAKGRSRTVFITQNPGDKQDRILALLNRMGVKYRITGGRQIAVTSLAIFDALAQCTDPGEGRACYRKRVPEIVKAATPALIERFVEAAIMGDGWTQRKFRTYATTSPKLADDMQELFIKLGKSASVRVRKVQPCRIHGRHHVSVDQHHVSEVSTKDALLRRSNNTPLFRRVSYRGKVYCVTVPNGTLIMRRNGMPLVVGNCEAMAYAAAYMLGVQRLKEGARRPGERPARPKPAAEPAAETQQADERPPQARQSFLPRQSIW